MRGQSPRSSPFVLPSYPLTLRVGDVSLTKLDLRKTTQARREERFSPSVLRKNLRTSTPTILQVPDLQHPRQAGVQWILWICTCQVTYPLLLTLLLPVTHWLRRQAVQDGHALACAECGKQPQGIENMCLGCNSSLGRLTEPRLRELNLQDPTATSSALQTSATQLYPTDDISSHRQLQPSVERQRTSHDWKSVRDSPST